MQTFLPYDDFAQSAAVLDRMRQGKQRVEVLQISRALTGQTKGWVNHPATKMWQGHTGSLILYGQAVCEAWVQRGYKDTCYDKLEAMKSFCDTEEFELPSWFGDERLHSSHRSSLLRKAPEHYRQFWPEDSDSIEYWWPVK